MIYHRTLSDLFRQSTIHRNHVTKRTGLSYPVIEHPKNGFTNIFEVHEILLVDMRKSLRDLYICVSIATLGFLTFRLSGLA